MFLKIITWKKIILLLFVIFFTPAILLAQEEIAFSSLSGDYWQIWTMNRKGEELRQITFSQQDKRDPIWIDEGHIAFRTNNGVLFTVDLHDQHETQILKDYQHINNPNYCSVEKKFVFVRFVPQAKDRSEIWSATLVDEKATLLSKDNVLKYQPAFSNDCKTVAFVQADVKDAVTHNIWVMDAEGQNPRQITHARRSFETLPTFSPDNQSIAFSSNEAGHYDIYSADLNGTIQRLTDSPSLETAPNFSPNGKNLLLVSDLSGNQQIWILNLSTRKMEQLTNLAGEALDPAWASQGDPK